LKGDALNWGGHAKSKGARERQSATGKETRTRRKKASVLAETRLRGGQPANDPASYRKSRKNTTVKSWGGRKSCNKSRMKKQKSRRTNRG